MTEEVVYSRHNTGEVPQAANCGLKFLGGGSSVQEELANVCHPGNKFVLSEGDYQLSKIKIPTKDDLQFRRSCLCPELVSCVHALAGCVFFWMIWACGCINCEEGSSLCASDVVGAGDADSQADDVINVDVVHPLGVDGDVNNQLETLHKGD